jgi:drug/metabolite transporter (DMT)-like permease
MTARGFFGGLLSEASMSRRVLIYTVILIVLWGSHSPVVTLTMGSGADNPLSRHALLFFKFLLGSACLFVVIALSGRLSLFRGYSWKRLARLVFAGACGYFLYYFFLFWALDRARPEDAVTEAVVINYLFPMCTLLASAAIIAEKLTVRGVVSAVISFAGAYLVACKGNFGSVTLSHPVIDLLAVLAAVSWGVFSALGRRWQHEPLTGMFVFLLTGLVISGCILPFTSGRHYPMGWEFYGVFHVGFLCNTLGGMLWFLALRHGGASLVGNLSLLAAFVNLAFIRLLLPDQTISPWAVAGLAVILLGVLLSRVAAPRQTQPS